jgi:leucyl/phenylalanyl-tRNA--protein transferase
MIRNRKAPPRLKITPAQVLLAYRHGLFPMSRGKFGGIEWFMADPRTIIPLDDRFHVPRTVRKLIRKGGYEIKINHRFPEVIRACARHHSVAEEIWLSDEMIELYLELRTLGYAHSIEVWIDDELVGGLYGVALAGAFFGESMFSRAPSASQLALVALVEKLRERQFVLLDAQMRTPHIARYGAVDLSHEQYLTHLSEALLEEKSFLA